MNILMALSQREVTGAEVYATTLGDELTQRGHNITYVSDTLTKPHQGNFFSLRFNKRSIPRRFWHVGYLIYLIKKHNIQLVHAHSRASSWSCHIACKLTNTPMVTTVHGRQPVHASRKRFHAMGDKALPVCEAIENQLYKDLAVPLEQMTVCRNGIETKQFTSKPAPQNIRPVITIIGRLTGPKGDLCYRLLSECLNLERYDIRVVSGSTMTDRFMPYTDRVTFTGYTNDVAAVLQQSNLVIGAGRVAIESLLSGRPTLAIGEAKCIGLISTDNITEAMATNFGDIGPKDLDIDFTTINTIVDAALLNDHCQSDVQKLVANNYNIASRVDQIEEIYQDVYVTKLRRDVPVIMYHRFINNEQQKGVHGTYMDINMLDKHFALLKKMGFETLTFKDLNDKGMIHRLDANKRYIMLTVDDGYKDNYELLLPLLEKYQFKATIFVVTGENFNRWDVESTNNPEKTVQLMTIEQIKALHQSGLVEIGGHTLHHPHLNTLTKEQQLTEIEQNKQQLEHIIGEQLTSFAYPYGSLNQDSKDIVQQLGFKFAVATNSGPLLLHKDRFQIRRIAIFPKTDVFGLWRKVRGNYLFRKVKP